jgi:hypothetical protein
VLYPTRLRRRGVRSWWREHVTGPLEATYVQLDEHQQDDEQS